MLQSPTNMHAKEWSLHNILYVITLYVFWWLFDVCVLFLLFYFSTQIVIGEWKFLTFLLHTIWYYLCYSLPSPSPYQITIARKVFNCTHHTEESCLKLIENSYVRSVVCRRCSAELGINSKSTNRYSRLHLFASYVCACMCVNCL